MAGLNTAQIADQAKSMGINLGGGDADAILKQAWDQGQFGADATKVNSLLSARRGASTASSGGSAMSAVQPAVDTLKGQIEPLKQRYDDLLKSIKGEQVVAENKQTTITNNELGKRGILGSSTLAGQEVENALQPVRSSFNSLYANTGLAREKELNSIAQAIAQMQATGAMQDIQAGNELEKLAMQLAAAKSAKDNYINIGEGDTLFDPKTGKPVYTAPKTYKDVQGGLNNPLGI